MQEERFLPLQHVNVAAYFGAEAQRNIALVIATSATPLSLRDRACEWPYTAREPREMLIFSVMIQILVDQQH
jgi:hypothetical protein